MPYQLPYANLTDSADIKVLIKEALWCFDPSVLILFTVRQYKKKCNKRRCIAIFDTFVSPTGPWHGAFGDNSDALCVATVTHMTAMVNWMRDLRTEAAQKNIFARIASSSNRAVATPTFFDQLMDLSHFNTDHQGALFNMVDPRGRQVRKQNEGWSDCVDTARTTLEAAGFDIKVLGLDAL